MLDWESLLPWMVIALTIITIVMLTLPTRYGSIIGKQNTSNRIQVLVLGDIGRSPRMQYHAISIAKHGCPVDIIGYRESALHPDIVAAANITVYALHPIPDFVKMRSTGLFLVHGPLKVLFQIWALWEVLGYRTKPARWMLVQNPPSIPTLLFAQFICYLRSIRLVIDWHNFGYSILALKLGNAHPLVQISRKYEQFFARFATAHFCVTNAMAKVLEKDYGITAPILPLHDRPVSGFQPMNESQRFDFLQKLPGLFVSMDCLPNQSPREDLEILVSEIAKGKAKLLVSSTSWTPDEDFSILLSALANYSELAITTHPHLPEIFAIITGKGPQKAHFLEEIKNLKANGKLEMVTIETAFLDMKDYAKLLGSASLGVSLHTSSSGVDLPMKVVDMFGAGLPVLGWGEFQAWPELVQEGVNGKSFRDSLSLQNMFVDLFGGDPRLLRELKDGALKEGKRRWDDEWDPIAGKLFGLGSERR